MSGIYFSMFFSGIKLIDEVQPINSAVWLWLSRLKAFADRVQTARVGYRRAKRAYQSYKSSRSLQQLNVARKSYFEAKKQLQERKDDGVTVPRLLRIARDSSIDHDKREQAIVILGIMQARESIQTLTHIARYNSSWRLRLEAVRALGEIGNMIKDTLSSIAQHDSNATVRKVATKFLRKIQGNNQCGEKTDPFFQRYRNLYIHAWRIGWWEGVHKNHNFSNYNRSMVIFQQAINMFPRCYEAFLNRAMIRAAYCQYESAINDYNIAIPLKPDFAHAYFNRGLCLLNLDRRREAYEDYNRAISLDPSIKSFNDSVRGKRILLVRGFPDTFR